MEGNLCRGVDMSRQTIVLEQCCPLQGGLTSPGSWRMAARGGAGIQLSWCNWVSGWGFTDGVCEREKNVDVRMCLWPFATLLTFALTSAPQRMTTTDIVNLLSPHNHPSPLLVFFFLAPVFSLFLHVQHLSLTRCYSPQSASLFPGWSHHFIHAFFSFHSRSSIVRWTFALSFFFPSLILALSLFQNLTAVHHLPPYLIIIVLPLLKSSSYASKSTLCYPLNISSSFDYPTNRHPCATGCVMHFKIDQRWTFQRMHTMERSQKATAAAMDCVDKDYVMVVEVPRSLYFWNTQYASTLNELVDLFTACKN